MMKRQWIAIICVAVLSGWSHQARADDGGQASGVTFFPSVMFTQQTGTAINNQFANYIDFRGGYLTEEGYYLGLIYSRTLGTGPYGFSQASYGNTLGYFVANWEFMANYFFVCSRDEKAPNYDMERSEGMGFQLDIAYSFPLVGTFAFAPMLSYRAITYQKSQLNGGEEVPDMHSETEFLPYLGFLLTF